MIAILLAALMALPSFADPGAAHATLLHDGFRMTLHLENDGAVKARTSREGLDKYEENVISGGVRFKHVFGVLDRAFGIDLNNQLVEFRMKAAGTEAIPSIARGVVVGLGFGSLIAGGAFVCGGFVSHQALPIVMGIAAMLSSSACFFGADGIGQRAVVLQTLEYFGSPWPFTVDELRHVPETDVIIDVMIAREGGRPESLFKMIADERDCARNLAESKLLIR